MKMQKKTIAVMLTLVIFMPAYFVLSQVPEQPKPTEDVFQLAFPALDLSPFLPQQKAEGNAAEFYVKAISLFEQYPGKDRILKDIADKPDAVLQDHQVRQMLFNVYEAARIKNCDLKIVYPVPASCWDKMPDFNFFQAMTTALAKEMDTKLQKKDYPTAIELAKTIVAVGNHLRQSAYLPIPELVGISLERKGIQKLHQLYQGRNDKVSADFCQQGLDKLQQHKEIIQKKLSAKGEGENAPEVATLKAMLKDREAIMRLEALIIIGTAFDPNRDEHLKGIREQLIKQFGAELAQKMFTEQDTSPYYQWLRTQKEELKSAITPMLNDPDQRVRDVATIVLSRLK